MFPQVLQGAGLNFGPPALSSDTTLRLAAWQHACIVTGFKDAMKLINGAPTMAHNSTHTSMGHRNGPPAMANTSSYNGMGQPRGPFAPSSLGGNYNSLQVCCQDKPFYRPHTAVRSSILCIECLGMQVSRWVMQAVVQS
jgi:hypothetical protein